jgi:hypothetical protein
MASFLLTWLKALRFRGSEIRRRPSKHQRRFLRTSLRPYLETLEKRELLAWNLLTNVAPAGVDTMLLRSDGTVMAQKSGGANWYQLTPDLFGNYVSGTWSSLASMAATRLYYASDVLPSGNIFVLGGEYSSAGDETNHGEIYNPVSNTWSATANYPLSTFGDGPAQTLPDGRILAGFNGGSQNYIYNPGTNTWTAAANKLHSDSSAEESWVKLPDGSILTYDLSGNVTRAAQRYVPSSNTWVAAGIVPVELGDNGGANIVNEIGGAFLLPDGRAFFLGATGNTAFYTPATNTWTAGPAIPGGDVTADAPGAMMPNGHVLFAASPHLSHDGMGNPIFPSPTRIYEFNPGTNTYTNVTPGGYNLNMPSYQTRMLVLPSGQVALSNGSGQIDVYTPAGGPSFSWEPQIAGISRFSGGSTVTLTGTQINGISEGASYGDDASMSSNYPLVQLLGVPFFGNPYLRTFNWSSTGVAEGSTPESAQFQLGTGIDVRLHVVANGIASPTALAIEMSPSVNDILLRVDPGNPANLEILNHGSFFDSVPFSSFSSIMVTCDNSTDTLTVDHQFGNPIPLLGLNYQDGAGVDTLNVNDTTTSSNQTWTLNSSSILRSGSNTISFSGGINFVNVNGGNGNNTYNVYGTEPSYATTLNTGSGVDTVNVFGTTGPLAVNSAGGGGNDVVNVGNGGSLAGIFGSVSIENEPSSDTVNVFGQNEGAAHVATIDTVIRSGDTSLGRLQGVCAPITWDYFDTSKVNVYFGSGTSVVNVLGTGVPTNVFNSADATVNVGSGNSVAGIVGTLNLENEPAYDTVNVNDQSDVTAHTATIDTATRSGETSLGRLQGIGAAPITWDYNDTTAVNLNFGSGTSTVNVLGTGVITNLFNNAAATINVGSGNSVAGILGALSLENEPSQDLVNVNDQSDTTAHTATIDTVTRSGDTSLGRLTGIGAAAITWDYFDTAFGVNVNLGNGSNVVNVLGTGVTTNIFSTVFSTVNVGSGNTVAGILGQLNLENEPSTDIVIVNDQNDANFRSALIETVPRSGETPLGRLSGLAGAPITWDYFDTSSVTINTGSGGAGVTVLGTGPITTLNGNVTGANTLVGANLNTTWNVTGANAGNYSNAGAAVSFTGYQNLSGGAGNNTFALGSGASLDGAITGGGGTNTLDYSAFTDSVIVDLQTGQATAVAGGVSGIANVQGANSGGPGLYNLLIGNGGNVLSGGTGRRNILVAGATAGALNGGNQEDLVIGGTTSYDTEAWLVSWQAIAAYWAGPDSYDTRVSNLENGIGVPLLDATVVTGNGGGNVVAGAGALALIYTDGADTISGFDPALQTYPIAP